MSVLDVIRKGFGFVLMSMGVSSPKPKAKPVADEKKQGTGIRD
jgi:hypothetical protein